MKKKIYSINIRTLNATRNNEYIKLTENDFLHLQTWILAVYLGKLEEKKIRFTPLRDNGILVSLSIKGNRKDIEQIEEEIRKTYGIMIDLNVGFGLGAYFRIFLVTSKYEMLASAQLLSSPHFSSPAPSGFILQCRGVQERPKAPPHPLVNIHRCVLVSVSYESASRANT